MAYMAHRYSSAYSGCYACRQFIVTGLELFLYLRHEWLQVPDLSLLLLEDKTPRTEPEYVWATGQLPGSASPPPG